MYKSNNQLSIDDFYFPYGKLREDNRWVVLADMIPWFDIEQDYASKFVNNGAPAHPARMALGSLIIKQMLDVSDEEFVCQIAENVYLQYFIGLKEFQESCPFGASTLVAFRKRFPEEDIRAINETILAKNEDDSDDEPGGGTLSLDATVAPSDITYPQDVKLINSAREHAESIIDDICKQTGAKRPRIYRQRACKDFLNWSKSKKRSAKKTRVAIRKQLGYLRRNLRYITEFKVDLAPDIDENTTALIETLSAVYGQQKHMYDTRTHSVRDRIVSIPQPWVRPIVRGKAHVNTEFGTKLHISTDAQGFARIDMLSFDAYNEGDLLIDAIEAYRERTGRYPGIFLQH